MAETSTNCRVEADVLDMMDTVVPSCGTSRASLMQLPQELIDMIMEFAFARTDQVHYLWKKSWEDREAFRECWDSDPEYNDKPFGKKGEPYRVRPFRGAVVSDFLVSKTFFLSAARTLLDQCYINAEFRFVEVRADGNAGIIAAFAKEATTVFEHELWLPPMPRLKKLHLKPREKLFLEYPHRVQMWTRALTEEDFEATMVPTLLQGVGKDVQLEMSAWGPDLDSSDPQQNEIFKANIKTFERVLQRNISSGRAATYATQWCDEDLHGLTPLYRGSRVCLESPPSGMRRNALAAEIEGETSSTENASSSAVREELQCPLATEDLIFSGITSPKLEPTPTFSRPRSADKSPQQLSLSKIIGLDIAPSAWPASRFESYVATSAIKEASSVEAKCDGDQITWLPKLQALLTAGDPMIVEWAEKQRAMVKLELVEEIKTRMLGIATNVLTLGLALLLVLLLYYSVEEVFVPGELTSAGNGLPKAVKVGRWIAVNRH